MGKMAEPPPKPPVLPTTSKSTQFSIKTNSNVSPFIKKLQAAPEGYWFKPEIRSKPVDPLSPPCGFYFFYGTLMDPCLLAEILSLPEKPKLRPAKLLSYTLKLWGQYPALVDGEPSDVIEGKVYNVKETKHTERLAEYETKAYWPTPCRIYFTDEEEPREVNGSTLSTLEIQLILMMVVLIYQLGLSEW